MKQLIALMSLTALLVGASANVASAKVQHTSKHLKPSYESWSHAKPAYESWSGKSPSYESWS